MTAIEIARKGQKSCYSGFHGVVVSGKVLVCVPSLKGEMFQVYSPAGISLDLGNLPHLRY